LPKIVNKAHAANLRVSAHVTNSADFHHAVAAGIDEITHVSLTGLTPITQDDAKMAAVRRVVVVTTCAIVPTLRRTILAEADVVAALQTQAANLKLLFKNGVSLVIGSDNVTDSSLNEVEYLKGLGVFDNLTLLRMWTGATAKTIFPMRRIGKLSEGFEAGFLALDGDPNRGSEKYTQNQDAVQQGFLLEQ
jgi:imidazolonepropionase-like amidohydrolase